MSDLFASFPLPKIEPRTNQEWNELFFLLGSTFSPHQAINDRELFAGRIDLITKIVDSVFMAGKHVVLYGDRGVGKSSLANSIKATIQGMGSDWIVEKRNCSVEYDFGTLWKYLLDGITLDGKTVEQFLPKDPTPYDVFKILQSFPEDKKMVFILDEFDRVFSDRAKTLLNDLIKYLSDEDSRTTIILVGVAKSISALFAEHASLPRAMQQVYMPRMRADELAEIVSKRLPPIGMKISAEALTRIVTFSQGFPGYTHLMALHASRFAIKRKSVDVEQIDLQSCLKTVVEESDEAVTSAYHNAVQSTRAINQYREVLLACALADTDERNRFTARSVGEKLHNQVLGYSVAMTSFGRNLEQFCNIQRGPALIREGSTKNYHYSFEYPLLKPYVIIKALSDKNAPNQFDLLSFL